MPLLGSRPAAFAGAVGIAVPRAYKNGATLRRSGGRPEDEEHLSFGTAGKGTGGGAVALMRYGHGAAHHDIAQSPSTGDYLTDRLFRFLAMNGAASVILLIALILWQIGAQALMFAALTLLAISLIVNVVGTWLLEVTRRRITGEL
jgi:hypothetical protein